MPKAARAVVSKNLGNDGRTSREIIADHIDLAEFELITNVDTKENFGSRQMCTLIKNETMMISKIQGANHPFC